MIKVKTEENTLLPQEMLGEVLLQAMEALSEEAPQLPWGLPRVGIAYRLS